MAKCSLALVAVLVAVEAVGVAAWVLALVVELTCAWRPQGRTASFQKVCAAEFISRKLLAARPRSDLVGRAYGVPHPSKRRAHRFGLATSSFLLINSATQTF